MYIIICKAFICYHLLRRAATLYNNNKKPLISLLYREYLKSTQPQVYNFQSSLCWERKNSMEIEILLGVCLFLYTAADRGIWVGVLLFVCLLWQFLCARRCNYFCKGAILSWPIFATIIKTRWTGRISIPYKRLTLRAFASIYVVISRRFLYI